MKHDFCNSPTNNHERQTEKDHDRKRDQEAERFKPGPYKKTLEPFRELKTIRA